MAVEGIAFRIRPRRWIARTAVLSVLVAGSVACDRAGDVVGAMNIQINTVSMLTVNIQGRDFKYGGKDVPWRDRYLRPITWMKNSGTWPDVIALQEMPLRKRFFAGGLDPADYEALFLMIAEARNRGGPEYRVAYASTAYVHEGAGPLYQGRAMLYNPKRLINKSGLASSAVTPVAWDSNDATGPNRRANHPCEQVAEKYANFCPLVDIDAAPWVGGFRDTGGNWRLGPTAALFEAVWDAGQFLLIFNVHLPTDDAALPFVYDDLTALINSVHERWSTLHYLYPYVILGDFNTGRGDMDNEVGTSGHLGAFRIAGGSAIEGDVMWALVGNDAKWVTKFAATMTTATTSLPPGITIYSPGGICGDVDIAWTDHCSVLLTLGPQPPNSSGQ